MTGKRMYTVMVIPHSEKPPITLKIPLILIQSIFVFITVMVFFTILWGLQYSGMKKEMQELKTKALQAKALNKEFASMTEQVLDLQKQVELTKRAELNIKSLVSSKPSQNINQISLHKDKSVSQVLAFSIGDTKKAVEQLKVTNSLQMSKYQTLLKEIENRNKKLAHIPSIYPTWGRLTSRFGYRKDPLTGRGDFHPGLDIANTVNTPVYATADGIIIRAGRNGGYGNQITINHGNGIITTYAHLLRISIKENDSAIKGQLIGFMGNTGRSTGPHLHYEVHVNNELVNPIEYLPK